MGVQYAAQRKDKLIFLADDSSTVRKLVTQALDQAGFEYDWFENGAKLTDFLRKYSSSINPDVIILDVEMPVMDGFEACRVIKRSFPEVKAPILFFTSSHTEDSKIRAWEVGGDEFIVKPFTSVEFVDLLDNWVSKTTRWDSSQVTNDASRQDKLVMIADDSKTILKMATMAMEMAGYKVAGYEDGHGLIIGLEEMHPAVIILDIEMPDMTGFETCEKARKEFPDLKAPILFFTSHNTDEYLTIAKLVGGNGFFSKSMKPSDFIAKVEKWSKIEVDKNPSLFE